MTELRRVLLAACWVILTSSVALAQEPTRRLVVIDPGHGGVDPGAIGPGGTREKDVVLRVARALANELLVDPSIQVRLTRSNNVLVPLEQRARLANRWRDELGAGTPALFVSIHANAHEQQSARGFETYFLSEALTEDARRVEAMENASRRFEGALASDPLDFILSDLRLNLYLRESSESASLIQHKLDSIHPGPDRGVKQAGFVVLAATLMPAVLVEIGFVTNPEDESILRSESFADSVAIQLASAILEFFALSARSETVPVESSLPLSSGSPAH